MKYAPNKKFTFPAMGGILPTIKVGDLCILVENEELMSGKKYYSLEPDNSLGLCNNREYHTYTYHGHIRTVDDIATRARGLHKVLEIGDIVDPCGHKTHCMITVGEDLKEDWE